MPTVTHSIGSASRDFATIALWDASLPANFVTDGNSQVGQLYNDSEFVITADISLSGHTTDATHTMTITTAAGQSFQDNAGVRTNPLKYDVTKGVGIRRTAAYGSIMTMNSAIVYLTISKIQFSRSNASAGTQVINDANNLCTNALYKDLLIETQGTSGTVIVVAGAGTVVANVLVIVRSSSALTAVFQSSTSNVLWIGCGAVRCTDFSAAGVAFQRSYGTPILQSCYSFGFTTPSSATGWDATNSKNNATDKSAIAGGSAQTSVTFSSVTPFTSATDATRDFRAIAATALAGNGFKDSTDAPNDISGTARAASPTIGPWEIASAVPASIHHKVTGG
jgi:hypothetical protein